MSSTSPTPVPGDGQQLHEVPVAGVDLRTPATSRPGRHVASSGAKRRRIPAAWGHPDPLGHDIAFDVALLVLGGRRAPV